jgi:4-carboxymuconolactone decarboxylase
MPAKSKTGIVKNKVSKKEVVLGYLPEIYQGFNERYPAVSKAIDAVAETCQKAGPLNSKTSELIKLGIAIGINSEGAVRSHARRALEEGISPQEIRQVVLLAFVTNGFPHTIAAYKWVEEVLAKT